MVPLHGRLFSQWLHYVFPRECAFLALALASLFGLSRPFQIIGPVPFVGIPLGAIFARAKQAGVPNLTLAQIVRRPEAKLAIENVNC